MAYTTKKLETFLPQSPDTYQGNQVLINSDRLVFNAKNDSILLFSDKVIGFSTNGSFHFDTSGDEGKSKFVVNSPNIYLGLEFDNTLPTQPAVLGDELVTILEDILDMCQSLSYDMAFSMSYTSTSEGTLTGMNDKNGQVMNKRIRQLDKIRNDLYDIMSQNTKLV